MTISDRHSTSLLEATVERIDGDEQAQEDGVIERDRQAMLEFHERVNRRKMATDKVGDHYHNTMLRMLLMMATQTESLAATLDEDEGREAVDDILSCVTEQEYSGYTIQTALSTLRMFAAMMLDLDPDEDLDEQLPKRFAEICPSEHVEYDPAPLPANVVKYDEIIEMVKSQDRIRNMAMLMVQWGAGLRPMAELWPLQRRHIEDKGDHIKITVPADTKTGRREVILVVGAPLFRKWLYEQHPAHLPGEPDMCPDTYIWTHHKQNKHLGYSAISTVFENAGEAIDLEKDHTPRHMRRSAASVMASRPNISERDLRKRFGWSRNSEAPEHYIAAMDDPTEVSVAQAYGHDIEDKEAPPPIAPITCAHCEKWTVRKLDQCIWCSHEIDEDLQEMEHVVTNPLSSEKDLLDMIIDGDVDADDLRSLKKLKPVVRSRPDLFDELDKLIHLAEGYEDEESDSVNLVTGPVSLGAHLSQLASRTAKKWTRAKHLAFSLHPSFSHYPPDKKTAGKLVAGFAMIIGMYAMLIMSGIYGDGLQNGDPFAVTGAVTGLAIGTGMVVRDMPSVDEALDELRKRK